VWDSGAYDTGEALLGCALLPAATYLSDGSATLPLLPPPSYATHPPTGPRTTPIQGSVTVQWKVVDDKAAAVARHDPVGAPKTFAFAGPVKGLYALPWVELKVQRFALARSVGAGDESSASASASVSMGSQGPPSATATAAPSATTATGGYGRKRVILKWYGDHAGETIGKKTDAGSHTIEWGNEVFMLAVDPAAYLKAGGTAEMAAPPPPPMRARRAAPGGSRVSGGGWSMPGSAMGSAVGTGET